MVSSISSSAGSSSIQQLMAEFQKKLKSADTDGKSGLSKDELSSIDTGDDKGGAAFLKNLTQNFDKLDTDGDGQLSQTEIKAARPHRGQMGPPPGMMIEDLTSADTDGTTGLSKNELSSIDTSNDKGKANFINNLTKNFDKLDTNQDGQLSAEEIEAGKPQGSQPEMQAQAQTQTSGSGSGNSSATLGSGDISSYLLKMLSSAYQNNTAASSSLDFAG